MEKMLDILSHTAVFIFIGYIFYAMYKMHKQDKELSKHEKIKTFNLLGNVRPTSFYSWCWWRTTIKNGWASMPNLQTNITKYSILSIFRYMFLYMQVFLYPIIALFRDLMVHIKYLLNHQHNRYTD